MDFAESIWIKSYGENYWFAALAMSALRRLRVQSDLLDRTAFEALPLVLCTKRLIYKKVVDTSLHPSTSWG